MLTTLQLFGVAGLAVVVVWLMVLVTFTTLRGHPIPIPHAQYQIIRYISALIAGIAGYLFSYDLNVVVSGEWDQGTKVAISSGGAAAAFVLVFLFYPKLPQAPPSTPASLSIDIPASWTFEQAVIRIAELMGSTADCSAFPPRDRKERLVQDAHIQAQDVNAALSQLKKFLPARFKSFAIRKDAQLNQYVLSP